MIQSTTPAISIGSTTRERCDLSPSQSDMYNQGNFPENLLIEKKQINFGAQIDFIKSPKSLTKNRTTLNDTYKNQKTSTINRSLISPESEQTYSINQNELEIFNKLQDQNISKSNLEESQTDLKNSLIEFEIIKKTEMNTCNNLLQSQLIRSNTFSPEILNEKKENCYGQKNLTWFISTFYLVKKFIKIMKKMTLFRMSKWIKESHLEYLNDNAYFNIQKKNNLQNSIFKTLLNLVWTKLTLFPTFKPNRMFCIIWNLIVCLLIILNIFRVTIYISFDLKIFDFEYEGINILNIIKFLSLLVFSLNLFILANTEYYEKGSLISDHKKIFKNFIYNDFLISLIGLLPLIMEIFDFHVNKFLWLFIMIKTRRLKSFLDSIDEFIEIDESWQNILALIKLILSILFLTHIFACIWHFIALSNPENSWVNEYNLNNEGWEIRYLFSIYYVCVSMNTVGYGDVVPHTHVERVYSVIFIYIACFIFAYSVNSIGIILQNINKKNSELKRKLNVINNLMRRKNINAELRIRIRKYLNFVLEEEKQHNEIEEAEVLAKLTDSLSEELIFEANSAIIKKMPMLFMNFSEPFLMKIVQIIKEIRLTPNEILFRQGSTNDKSLYMIRSGQINLFYDCDTKEIEIKQLGEGEVLGQYSFFSDFSRICSAKSSVFSTLYKINQEDFLGLIKNYPHDYEVLMQIKDKINLYQCYDNIFASCFICKESNHFIEQCPHIHYKPYQLGIISKFTFSKPQIRQIFKRKSSKRINSISVYKKFQNIDYFIKHLGKIDLINREINYNGSFESSGSTSNEDVSNAARTSHSIIRRTRRNMTYFSSSKTNEISTIPSENENTLSVIQENETKTNFGTGNSTTTLEKLIEKKSSNDNLSNNFEFIFEEKMKNFVNYFPHNNSENVAIVINKYLDLRVNRKLKLNRLKNYKILNMKNSENLFSPKKRETIQNIIIKHEKNSIFSKFREDKEKFGNINGLELFKFLKTKSIEKNTMISRLNKKIKSLFPFKKLIK